MIRDGIEVHRKPTPADRYLRDEKGRQAGRFRRALRPLLSVEGGTQAHLFICGAAKILTDAGTVREGAIRRRLNAIALALTVQSFSKSSCAGFSHPSLWWFLQEGAPFQKKLKCQTTLVHQINHEVGAVEKVTSCA